MTLRNTFKYFLFACKQKSSLLFIMHIKAKKSRRKSRRMRRRGGESEEQGEKLWEGGSLGMKSKMREER